MRHEIHKNAIGFRWRFFYFETENIFVIYIKINIKFAKFNAMHRQRCVCRL